MSFIRNRIKKYGEEGGDYESGNEDMSSEPVNKNITKSLF